MDKAKDSKIIAPSKEPKYKPLGVTIKALNTLPLPTNMGSIVLQCMGLGSDDIVYEYDFKLKKWQEREA